MSLKPVLNSLFFQKVGPANLLLNHFVMPICQRSYMEKFRSWQWPENRIPLMREQPIVQNSDAFFRMRKIINITFVSSLSVFILGNFALKIFSVVCLVLVVATTIILFCCSRDVVLRARRLGQAWAVGCAYVEYIRLVNSRQTVSDFIQRGANEYIEIFRPQLGQFRGGSIMDLRPLFKDHILPGLPEPIQLSIKQFDAEYVFFTISKIFFVYSLGNLSAETLPKREGGLQAWSLFTEEMEETIQILRQMKQAGVISEGEIQACRTVFAKPEDYPDQLPEVFKNMVGPHLVPASRGAVGQVMQSCLMSASTGV